MLRKNGWNNGPEMDFQFLNPLHSPLPISVRYSTLFHIQPPFFLFQTSVNDFYLKVLTDQSNWEARAGCGMRIHDILVLDPDPDLDPRIHASDKWIRIRMRIRMRIRILLFSLLNFKMPTKN